MPAARLQMSALLVIGGTIAVTSISYIFFLKKSKLDSSQGSEPNDLPRDPGLLKKHSTQRQYHAAGFTYTEIRTFYHPHPQAAKLPTKPTPLPLLVFIHGLGGCAAQFAPLLTGLINAAPCLAIDLPGCGLSAFEPRMPGAYTTDSLARLVAEAISQHRDTENSQKIVLIGHSMGCSIATLLASSTSPLSSLISHDVAGFIALCPKASPPSESQASRLKYLQYMPTMLFDLFRQYDRRGGLESASVLRYAGKEADSETKRLQLQFNETSQSNVFLAMASGSIPLYSQGQTAGGLPGESVWSGLKVPTFCIAGESDSVCPPENVEMIAGWLGRHAPVSRHQSIDAVTLPTAAGEAPLIDSFNAVPEEHVDSVTYSTTKSPQDLVAESRPIDGAPESAEESHFVLKTTILPSPASHALLYATSTVRILSGLMQSFFATHVDHRLSLGWQLQHLATEGKWDVKNLQKWQAIQPVSDVIAGVFRAMKTLREVDEKHTPKVFVQEWGARRGVPRGVRAIVDISHESPVYDPKGLEMGGVHYHKFPTVSKLPPTVDEVRAFIALIDTLRAQLESEESPRGAVIGVHCHYGFNRTGFFIVCYLVERLGYRLQDALEEFAEKRAPGIRHEHFVNELYVRYCVGLQRRPTIC